MIQTTKKKLKALGITRGKIALLAGASPFILAFMLMSTTRSLAIFHDTGWINYLVQHQDDIIESLLISSVMVMIFSTLLHKKVAIFFAGFQTVAIQAMVLLTDPTQHIALNIPLVAITVLPILILLLMLGREIDQPDNQDKEGTPH